GILGVYRVCRFCADDDRLRFFVFSLGEARALTLSGPSIMPNRPTASPTHPGNQEVPSTTAAPNRVPAQPVQGATQSGIPLKIAYTANDLESWDPAASLAEPGEFPFTRGIYPTMYRGKPWTMRQYAGFGTAAQSNARFRYLLAQGQTGLSVAFDLPTQIGLDPDHPRAEGEVGKV